MTSAPAESVASWVYPVVVSCWLSVKLTDPSVAPHFAQTMLDLSCASCSAAWSLVLQRRHFQARRSARQSSESTASVARRASRSSSARSTATAAFERMTAPKLDRRFSIRVMLSRMLSRKLGLSVPSSELDEERATSTGAKRRGSTGERRRGDGPRWGVTGRSDCEFCILINKPFRQLYGRRTVRRLACSGSHDAIPARAHHFRVSRCVVSR